MTQENRIDQRENFLVLNCPQKAFVFHEPHLSLPTFAKAKLIMILDRQNMRIIYLLTKLPKTLGYIV